MCHVIYYSLFIIFLYAILTCHLLKLHNTTSKKTITIKLGGNIYQIEMVVYLHTTKVALMKGTYLNAPHDI